MSEAERCPECGSWAAQCAADTPVDGCGCARCLRATVERLRAATQAGRDLMAVVHGDGGHYRERHGDRKAADDAIAAVNHLRAERDGLRKAVDAQRILAHDMLDDMSEIHAERDAALDCRTCMQFTTKAGGCLSLVKCVGASQYRRNGAVRIWEAMPR